MIPENVEQFLASQRNGLLATFLQDEIKYGELFDKLIKGFEMMIYIEKFSRDIYGRHEDETGRPRLLGSSVSPEQRRMTIKSMMWVGHNLQQLRTQELRERELREYDLTARARMRDLNEHELREH